MDEDRARRDLGGGLGVQDPFDRRRGQGSVEHGGLEPGGVDGAFQLVHLEGGRPHRVGESVQLGGGAVQGVQPVPPVQGADLDREHGLG